MVCTVLKEAEIDQKTVNIISTAAGAIEINKQPPNTTNLPVSTRAMTVWGDFPEEGMTGGGLG